VKKILIIIVAIAFLVLVGFKVREKLDQSQTLTQQTAQKSNKPASSIPAVKVMKIFPQPIKESLKLVGNVEAETEIAIQPRINGRLVSLLVEEGQLLTIGGLIGEMDDEAIRLQLQQSEANLASLKANTGQAEINVNKSKTEKERYQELLDKRYISQRDYENVENSYLTSQAALESLKAQLQASQKNYELLKLQLNQTKITSPLNGYVLKKLVTPGVNLTTGTTIITAAALNPVKLTFTVDQKDTSKITKGAGVNFVTDAYPDLVFEGRVNQLAPTYDSKTRTIQLSASLSNPLNKLVPGMFGTAEIIIGNNPRAMVVSQEAVVTEGNKTGVFIVGSDSIARFRPVETGLISEGKVEIAKGLQNGDSVVTIGQNRLRDGQQVQLLGGGGGERSKGKGNWSGNQGESSPGKKPTNRKAGVRQ
jgi:membrane fusion protein, multidrug efflux system